MSESKVMRELRIAQERETEMMLERDAERLGVDPSAWKRLHKMVWESPMAMAIFQRINDHAYTNSETPISVILLSLLVDVVEAHDVVVKRAMDDALHAPAPRIKIDGL